MRFDPQQAPARAELLLAADFGRQAPGRPIHGRLESEDNGAGDPGPRLKVGAVQTRRLAATRHEAELLPVLAGPTAAGPPTPCSTTAGRCRPCPESAGDLARIDGVTPRTRPRSAKSSPRPETIANPLGRALLSVHHEQHSDARHPRQLSDDDRLTHWARAQPNPHLPNSLA